ncbi:MAG: leucyl aminopeptidase [Actinobacteria bacterium]|jgi:leucyl aminopeptidase|nr:leucyl aminopeptidase [Actinomycetota bacterium]MBT3686693.1 leucyl aminopeptidase [Actinomycetota bacterium]MBT4038381.1 leucyl aminopeptidase [Actinomycetota bacterium]MBT4279669.1 leucyl aminopeptidase [Actinomycetota bacterium]MBT4343395.1 leucyl aminopeptidase [Actinomycetota bacterium]
MPSFTPPTFVTARTAPSRAAVVAHGLTQEALGSDLPDGLTVGDLKRLGFKARPGQVQMLPNGDRLVAAVGLGPADRVTTDVVRNAAADLARATRRHRTVATDLAAASGIDAAGATRAVVEGMTLALYRFGYRSRAGSGSERDSLSKVTLVGSTAAGIRAAVETGVTVAGGVTLARDLVNEPGGSLTAPAFANRVRRVAKEAGVTVKVLDEAAIRRAGMGGLLGVSRGSANPPRFVELTYTPKGVPVARRTGDLALVGKGITFDSGGLSIKSGTGMMDMKKDMAGAAAVVGAMSVLPALAPRCRVRAYLPMTDNMLGGDATRPGDVLTIRNGKTIEVLNTDAEGRLVLADALSMASEAGPDAIVDLATLTGACMVALGPRIAGLMGNNDGFVAQVEAASAATGERVWHLPLPADYRKMLDSTVADMKNIGGQYGGALTAGLVLAEFVGEGIPWAHIDIAGPSSSDADEEERTKGATGFGVRLLVELVSSFQKVESD